MVKHVVYSLDSCFIPIFLTSVKSLLEHNNDVVIHVLCNNLTNEEKLFIKDKISNNNLYFYKIQDKLKSISDNLEKLNGSLSTYGRLFISDIIYQDIVLYLDCDTLIRSNLDELLTVDISMDYLAAVKDPVSKKDRIKIGLNKFDDYINAGVILFNLKKMRTDNIKDRFIEFIRLHDGCVAFHDQGVINAVCKDKIYYLDQKYNVTSQFYLGDVKSFCYRKIFRNKYSMEEIDYFTSNAKIVHFTGAFFARPWQSECRHPYKNEFEKYYRQMDFNIERKSYSIGYRIMAMFFYNFPYPFYIFVNTIVNWVRKLRKHLEQMVD